MKKLALLVVLFAGCIHFVSGQSDLDFVAQPEAGGTRVTIKSQGVSVLLPADGQPRGAAPYQQDTWIAGVMASDGINVKKTEVQIMTHPDVTTLADVEAGVHLECLKSEVLSRHETASGFDLLFGCTGTDLSTFYRAIHVADVGGRKIECYRTGTVAEAREGQRLCATMQAAAPATVSSR